MIFGIIVLVGIVLFFGWALSLEQKETYKAVLRSIEIDIKNGILIRLTDGRIAETSSISIIDKRLTTDFVYLVETKKFLENYLDNLSVKELSEVAAEVKREEDKIKRQQYEIQRREMQKEGERQEELIRIEVEKRKKENKKNLWLHLRADLKQQVFPTTPFEGVYVIYCLKTDDFYIGSSANIGQRIKQHLYSLKSGTHKTYRLQEDFQKYGEESLQYYLIYRIEDFEQEVFFHRDVSPREKLEKLEQQAIDKYSPFYNVYKDVKQGKFDHLNKFRT